MKLRDNKNSQNKSKNNDILDEKLLKELILLYNRGDLENLINNLDILIKKNPNNFIIWNLLGASNKRLGNLDKAINAFKKVIRLNPNYSDGFNNLGVAFKDQGKINEALNAFKKAISLRPNYPEAYNNLGLIFRDQGKINDSLNSFKKAISLRPHYPEAYNNLGVILRDQGKTNESLNFFKEAINLKGDYAEAHYNLGISLQKLEMINKAIKSYELAINIKPDYAEAYNNIGVIYQSQRKFDQALKIIKKAISFNSNYPEAFYNAGVALRELGNINEAILYYNRAIKLKPNYKEAHYNLGIAFQELGKLDVSIKSLRNAVLLDPYFEKAKSQILYQSANICDWNEIEKNKKLIEKIGISKQYVSPFTILSLHDSPESHKLRSEVYAKAKYLNIQSHKIKKPLKKTEQIRIGYFSADFHSHATMHLIVRIFELHNKDKFKIFAYSYGPNTNDEMRQRLIKSVSCFRDIRLKNDHDVALLARNDKIDIAVDLKGYTKGGRTGIFAYRAAPIQINYLGYPGTLGTDFIDYIIADHVVIPEPDRNKFTEKIIFMPNSYQPNDNTRKISKKKITKNEMKLPEKGFIFCCFNNNYKILSREFSIWMRILNKVQDSVLWLLKTNEFAEYNLKKEAEKRGINQNRLIFANNAQQSDHLARHKLADLFLDTFNYNAHTTTSDALWSGLPVVTKLGKSFQSRVAGSLLQSIELPELVTVNEIDYESLILELATSPKKLIKITEKLEKNRHRMPLFNSEHYTKSLEKGFEIAYKKYFNQTKPEIIDIVDHL